jgi:hypothetical protein
VPDASSGALLHALRGHHGGVLGLALSDDGDLFSSGDDGVLVRWRTALLPARGGDGDGTGRRRRRAAARAWRRAA